MTDIPKEILNILNKMGVDSAKREPAPAGFSEGSFKIGPFVFSPNDGDQVDGFMSERKVGLFSGLLDAVLGGIAEGITQAKASPAVPFETEDNGIHLKANDLHIVHISDAGKPHAGMSVAYKIPHGGKTVEVATSLCHPMDRFAKKVGTRKAIDNFLAGKTVMLPVIAGKSVPATLQTYFESALDR